MEIPESWRRMTNDLVEETRTWAEGLKEEVSFISSRLKEFWDDPEKMISQPASEGNDLGTLAGIAPYLVTKGAKESGEMIQRLFEGAKAGQIDPADALGATMLGLGAGYPGGATGAAELGILRKAAVKKLAVEAKGIMKLAEGATDPGMARGIKREVYETLKSVIPAVRKVDQEWWDPVSAVNWKFYKNKKTSGEFDIDDTLAATFHPYKADERTVYHEIIGHGGQGVPPGNIQKAMVPYKGNLVPATEVLEYMKQVSRAWRGKKDYMENYYETDPIEMHARIVAKDVAKGIDPEEAFLIRLPKVIKSFESYWPETAKSYRTPLLERVASKAESRALFEKLTKETK